MNEFRHNLIRIRKARSMSQSDLAIAMGIDPSTISHYEAGRRSPNLDAANKFSEALGVSVDALARREGFTDFDAGYRMGVFDAREQMKKCTKPLLVSKPEAKEGGAQ